MSFPEWSMQENAVSMIFHQTLQDDINKTKLTAFVDCANAFTHGGGPAPDGAAECDMACNGNATEICGGPDRLSLYDYNNAIATYTVSASTASSTSSAAATPTIPGWVGLGCYNDTVGDRTLSTEIYSIPGASMTVELCLAACQAASFTLAGLEYAGECYCDNKLENYGGPASDGSVGCNMACNGNTTEICGGPNRLSMYSLSGWASLGCYNDTVGDRTLSTEIFSIPGASMTVELCQAACKAAGFTLAGVEYAGECYCDNKLENYGGPASDGSVGCNMACNGNAAETCGGPDRLNMYSLVSGGSSTTSSVSGTSTIGSSSTTSVAVPTSLPTGWKYYGCWIDQAYGRILGDQAPTSATLTVESCVAACIGLGYSIAGMEYYTQCYCGNSMINQAALATADTDCNTACGGNSAEICGGGDRMSIYSNETTLNITPVPETQLTGLPGSWNYVGCLM
jgi:uncharacterized protein (DUF2141 family)